MNEKRFPCCKHCDPTLCPPDNRDDHFLPCDGCPETREGK